MTKASYSTELNVLIIGYKRIRNVKRSIMKLSEYGAQEIFVALDYSNEADIRSQQIQLQEEMRDRTNVHFWLRKTNAGVAAGVITAIDWFFSNVESGAILEDDLEFDVGFLHFMTQGLRAYEFVSEVLMLSANRYSPQSDCGTTACNYPQIWGWATWRSQWGIIRGLITEVSLGNRLFNPLKKQEAFFWSGAIRVSEGFIDTWDLPLALCFYQEKFLCILPPVNLVTNTGSDVFASHTISNSYPMNVAIQSLENVNFKDIDEIKSEIGTQNDYLEKHVFRIRWYHVVSPAKLILSKFLHKINKTAGVPLLVRLARAESYKGFDE